MSEAMDAESGTKRSQSPAGQDKRHKTRHDTPAASISTTEDLFDTGFIRAYDIKHKETRPRLAI